MAISPKFNPTALQQNYTGFEVIYGANLLGTYTTPTIYLGDATDSVVYKPGLVLAAIAVGEDTYYINWKESGTGGQEIARAILIDNTIAPISDIYTTYGPYVRAVTLQQGQIDADKLIVTAGSDVATALTQLQAVKILDATVPNAYSIRGYAA